jgi:hypothetical protein
VTSQITANNSVKAVIKEEENPHQKTTLAIDLNQKISLNQPSPRKRNPRPREAQKASKL